MTNRNSPPTLRGKVGERLVELYLRDTSYDRLSVFETLAQLRKELGAIRVQEILDTIGLVEETPTEGRPGRMRIRRPDEPWRYGEWCNHRHAQAMIVGLAKAEGSEGQRQAVAAQQVYHKAPPVQAEEEAAALPDPKLSKLVVIRFRPETLLSWVRDETGSDKPPDPDLDTDVPSPMESEEPRVVHLERGVTAAWSLDDGTVLEPTEDGEPLGSQGIPPQAEQETKPLELATETSTKPADEESDTGGVPTRAMPRVTSEPIPEEPGAPEPGLEDWLSLRTTTEWNGGQRGWRQFLRVLAEILLMVEIVVWSYGVGHLARLAFYDLIAEIRACEPRLEQRLAVPIPPLPPLRSMSDGPLPVFVGTPARNQEKPKLPELVILDCHNRAAWKHGVCEMSEKDTVSSVARAQCNCAPAWRLARQLARENRICVPEWGLKTHCEINARRLPAGFLLALPGN